MTIIENLKPVTAKTRVPKNGDGKVIFCPCGHATTVYHFAWSSITCKGCKKMVDKYEFKVQG